MGASIAAETRATLAEERAIAAEARAAAAEASTTAALAAAEDLLRQSVVGAPLELGPRRPESDARPDSEMTFADPGIAVAPPHRLPRPSYTAAIGQMASRLEAMEARILQMAMDAQDS